MKFSISWLKEWTHHNLSVAELSHTLTMAGLEVDSVEPAASEFSGVKIARVTEVAPHPNANKLRVCQVDSGGESLQIVCGAANVREGMIVPLATVGAKLSDELTIQASELRGESSHGMLCSAKELGLAEQAEGLMPLPTDAQIGRDLRDYLELDDVIMEIDLTPNRGDCLSIAGVARELRAIARSELTPVAISDIEPIIEQTLPIELVASDQAPRYVGRVIRDIDDHAETPLWMVERLRRSGIRSLGAVVDITNYVMLELGQPMHAFDLDKISGGIRVRYAERGESLTLLDGKQVELTPDTLVIADHVRPLAMAGVMGGAESAVGESTRNLFFESAFFSPLAIAGKARAYGLHTDSSHRFERGVDFELQRRAVERATALLIEICGGRPGPVTDVVKRSSLPQREAIDLRRQRLDLLLGFELKDEEVIDILTRLSMEVTPIQEGWQVVPPSFRFDIAIEVDLIEELGRVYGYNRLPNTYPPQQLVGKARPEDRLTLDDLRQLLVARGYHEAITYSFVDPDLQRQLHPDASTLALANPISSELAEMRCSLWPGLLRALQHNINRQQARVRLFESGLKFVDVEGALQQTPTLALLASGSVEPDQWGSSAREVDFFDLKGDLEALLEATGRRARFSFDAEVNPALHDGRSARILADGEPVGWIGALHPRLESTLDLDHGVVLLEIELAALTERQLPRFAPLSRFPSLRRDLAFVVPDEVPAEKVIELASQAAPDLIESVLLFDVYRGKGVAEGTKSLALGLILQEFSRTLTDLEVQQVVDRVVALLSREVNAGLRE